MRSYNHSSVCTSCFITACSTLHLFHIFSYSTYALSWQQYSASSIFLFFLFLISYQASPPFLISSTTSQNHHTGLFPFNYIFSVSTFLYGQTLVAVSALTLLKSLNNTSFYFFLVFPSPLLKILYPLLWLGEECTWLKLCVIQFSVISVTLWALFLYIYVWPRMMDTLYILWYCQCNIAVWPDSHITVGRFCM